MRRAFERADALVWISQLYLRGERVNRSPVDVTLTISASDLRSEASEPTAVAQMGDTFVARETARRLSCDAGVVEVVEDEHGVPLRTSRKYRTIAGALKRALLRRDGRCTFPGCTHRTFLEGHHIRHWAEGGATSLHNAALLCSWHHRHVHEYGYSIHLGPDGRPRFRDPTGRLLAGAPEYAARSELGWPQIRSANAGLAIDADTIACEWDGIPPDYGALAGHLATLDGL